MKKFTSSNDPASKSAGVLFATTPWFIGQRVFDSVECIMMGVVTGVRFEDGHYIGIAAHNELPTGYVNELSDKDFGDALFVGQREDGRHCYPEDHDPYWCYFDGEELRGSNYCDDGRDRQPTEAEVTDLTRIYGGDPDMMSEADWQRYVRYTVD